MRKELFYSILNSMTLCDTSHAATFIDIAHDHDDWLIAFDSKRLTNKICVHIITEKAEFNENGVWNGYEHAIVVEILTQISKEDASVPLTDDQKEMFLDALQMLML